MLKRKKPYGKHKVEYVNWSQDLFYGFYESPLYNSDSEYNANEYLCDDEQHKPNTHYELNYWDFVEKTTKNCFDNLVDEINLVNINSNAPVLSEMELKGMSSPKEYNFSTDRLRIDIMVDFDKLAKYCFIDNRDKFDEYLRENFTSYDGFISFVKNNVVGFEREWNEHVDPLYDDKPDFDTIESNVMIQFWLLQEIDLDAYQNNCVENAYTNLYEYMELVEDENN